MKYGYVSYGLITPEWLSRALSEPKVFAKEMERVKEDLKAKGFHLKYWGHPYGVSENIMVMLVSDKGLDAYHSVAVERPYSGNRTILAYK